MNRILPFLITVILAVSVRAQTTFFTNISQFGMGSNLSDAAQSVHYDSESNIIVFGSYSEEMDFDPTGTSNVKTPLGSPDIFLAKYQQNGLLLWVLSLGRLSLDNGMNASSIAVNSNDDIFVSGSFSSNVNFNPLGDPILKTSNGGKDAFLAKYNASGELLWVNTYGSLFFEYGTQVVVDADDNIIYGIRYNGDVDADPSENNVMLDPQPGATDAAVIKYDSDGNYIWHYEISTPNSDNVTALSSSNENKIAIGATINGLTSGLPSRDMKLLILDNDGTLAFEYNYNNYENYNSITSFNFVEGENSLYVSGRIQGFTDFDPSDSEEFIIEPLFADAFFAKYNLEDYSLSWANHIHGSGIEDNVARTIVSGGALMAIGSFEGTATFILGDFNSQMISAGETDLYLVAYDNLNGSFLGAQIFGGLGNETAKDAHFDPTGNVVVAGEFANSLTFATGSEPISSFGSTDFFFSEFNFQINVSDGFNLNLKPSEVTIYPVPAFEEVTLEVEGSFQGYGTIRIFSIVGQVVQQSSFTNASNIKSINITDLKLGVYIVELNFNGECVSKKLVKQ